MTDQVPGYRISRWPILIHQKLLSLRRKRSRISFTNRFHGCMKTRRTLARHGSPDHGSGGIPSQRLKIFPVGRAFRILTMRYSRGSGCPFETVCRSRVTALSSSNTSSGLRLQEQPWRRAMICCILHYETSTSSKGARTEPA